MKVGTVSDLNGNTIEGKLSFYCPGCGYSHFVNVKQGVNPCWEFNNDFEKPTFTPSVLVHGQHICHSYVTDGKIKYLFDCSHQMAGQTITLPDL